MLWKHLSLLRKFSILSFLSVGLVAVVMGSILSRYLTQNILDREAVRTAQVIQVEVKEHDLYHLFTHSGIREDPQGVQELIAPFKSVPDVVRIKLWDRDTTILWVDDARLVGRRFAEDEDEEEKKNVRMALRGRIFAEIHKTAKAEQGLIEVYVPIIADGTQEVLGVAEVYKDPTLLFKGIREGKVLIWTVALLGGLLLYLSLFGIVRASYRTQIRLEQRLKEHADQLEQKVAERTRELATKSERLEGLATLSRRVSATLDTQQVFEFVVGATVRLLNANLSLLWLWDEAAGVLRLAAVDGDADLVDYPRKVSCPGQGMSGLVFERRESLITDAPATDPRFAERVWAQKKGIHAYAAVPLLVGERAVGVLTAVRRNPGSFQTEELTLMNSFAAQVAIALENARLYSEALEKTERLEGLIRTGARVTGTLKAEEVLGGIAEEAARLLGVEGAGFRLLKGDRLVIEGRYGLAQQVMLNPSIQVGESLSGLVAQEGRPISVPDVGEDQLYLPEHKAAAVAHDVMSYLGVPLRYRDRIIGVLNVFGKERRTFNEREVNLLQAFGDQAAIAIENARHMHEAESRARRLQTLTDVTRVMTSSLDPRQVANSIVEAAAKLLGVDLVRLWVGDETTQALHLHVSHGAEDLGATPHLRIGKGEGVIGAVWETGEPAFIPDLRKEPRWLNAPFLDRTGLRAFAGLPLVIEDRLIGALSLFTREVRNFTPEERETMALFAYQAAISLDKARLYREVTEQKQHLEETVAERKQAEAALQVAKDYAENLIGSSLDMIISADLQRKIVEFNRAAEETFGYSKAEVLGKPVDLLYADPSAGAQVFTTILEDGTFTGEVTNKRRTGETFCCYLSASVIRDASGRVAGGMGISRDITEQKRADEVLRWLGKAVETMQVGVSITDTTGKIVYTNPADASMHGYTVEELVGKSAKIYAPSELWKRVARPQVKEFNNWRRQSVNIRRDGSKFPVQLISGAVTDAAGEAIGIVTICEDITERKQAEEALQESNRRLEETLAELQATQQQVMQQERLRALGQMASGIAHDFNNALSPIVGFSELLLDRPGHLADEAKAARFLRMINTAGKDAANVVRRLREFYRAREEDEVLLPVDLNALVEEAINLTQPRWKDQAQGSGITIHIETDLQPIARIAANEAEIREVLTNLIFNAVDAMPEGGMLSLRTRSDADHVVLEVSDTGTGMTDEVRERCLDPFFSTKQERGTGLGLAMVYGIIQRHQGRLAIQSAPGRGTTFSIRLPGHTAPEPEDRAEEVAGPAQRLRVLVVEDELPVRELVVAYLTEDGHAVETAPNGREGLEKFMAGWFDVVVTDQGMPEMAGDQLAATIKQLAPGKPVILLTGFGDLMIASGEMPAGVDIILSKPVTLTALRQTLAKVTAN
ncbi:MAG: GAF domain-containing protein [Candidatus Methylomirabilales bacterium]